MIDAINSYGSQLIFIDSSHRKILENRGFLEEHCGVVWVIVVILAASKQPAMHLLVTAVSNKVIATSFISRGIVHTAHVNTKRKIDAFKHDCF
jgi:hypothetical protein